MVRPATVLLAGVIGACSGGARDPRDAGRADAGSERDAGRDDGETPDAGLPRADSGPPPPDSGPELELTGVIAAGCGVGESSTWDVRAGADLAECAPDAWLLEAELYEVRCRDEATAGRVYSASSSIGGTEPVASIALLRGTAYLEATTGTLTILEWTPGTSARIAWDVTLSDGTPTTGTATLTFCPPTPDARSCGCPPP